MRSVGSMTKSGYQHGDIWSYDNINSEIQDQVRIPILQYMKTWEDQNVDIWLSVYINSRIHDQVWISTCNHMTKSEEQVWLSTGKYMTKCECRYTWASINIHTGTNDQVRIETGKYMTKFEWSMGTHDHLITEHAGSQPQQRCSFLSVHLEAEEGRRVSAGVRLCLMKFWGKTFSYEKFKVAV